MRILIHDYAGHPFQVQLSRALAQRGHTVLHAYCGSLQTTPRGNLHRHDDTPGFEVRPIELDRPLEKFSFVTRWHQENTYGRLLARHVTDFQPEAVLSGNTPLDAQRTLQRTCRALNCRFVYWVQDLLGVATYRLLRKKHALLGFSVGQYYVRLERALLRKSDGVVLITEDFQPLMQAWSVKGAVQVIENWAPLEEVPVRPKANAWSQRHGLADKLCLLYAGTLGMKHNPELLLQLALQFRQRPHVCIVVVSQGLGADWLARKKAELELDNLVLLGFQPFEQMPEVLAAADVLMAVLEPEAGVFSVPSKVLTYLCAARPVLLAVPPENLAARIVARSSAGCIVPPTDVDAFTRTAAALIDDREKRETLGRNARRYAEAAFDIERIASAFEKMLIP